MSRVIRREASALGAVALAILLTVSCTVNQTISIHGDGSGTLFMHAEVTKLFRDYLGSLAEVSGKPGLMTGGKVFDAATMKKDFEARPGITVKKVVTPTPESVDIDLAYTSLRDVFSGDEKLSSAGALTYTEAEGRKTVRLHLDRTNYTQLSALFPLLNDPTVSSLAPQVNDTITDQEYLEMIRFSLGDDGPGLVKKSFITLTIDPDGDIVSQTGGTLSGGAVVFRIPLLRLLVLDKPLDYSVTFK
jgi:hypothetical protein